jgi:hypothetical protein
MEGMNMSAFYSQYRDAFNAACDLARKQGREVGLEKFKEFGKPGFRVFNLPNPKKRYGFETRCQVVGPTEPKLEPGLTKTEDRK